MLEYLKREVFPLLSGMAMDRDGLAILRWSVMIGRVWSWLIAREDDGHVLPSPHESHNDLGVLCGVCAGDLPFKGAPG